MMHHPNSKRFELLDLITKVSFAMDDTRLYLDTHPNCKEALCYFQTLSEKRTHLIKEYTKDFGPICSYDCSNSGCYEWNCGPLPWQSNFREGGC